ncbi:MAG: hypothetical protein ABDI07_11135, partial [Candidatus Kryptonium sp.]
MLKFCLIIVALFSIINATVIDPPSGSYINQNSFSIKLFTSGSRCVFHITGSNLPPEGIKYYGKIYEHECVATVFLKNGTYDVKAYLEGVGQVASATYYVTKVIPPGCEACERLNNTIFSHIFINQDKNNKKLYIQLLGENSLTLSRFPLKNSSIVVLIKNATSSQLYRITTNSEGIASLSYNHSTCAQYSFMYCCFYEECGFRECLRAFGLKDSQIGNITHVTQLPLAPGSSDYGLIPPIT